MYESELPAEPYTRTRTPPPPHVHARTGRRVGAVTGGNVESPGILILCLIKEEERPLLPAVRLRRILIRRKVSVGTSDKSDLSPTSALCFLRACTQGAYLQCKWLFFFFFAIPGGIMP